MGNKNSRDTDELRGEVKKGQGEEGERRKGRRKRAARWVARIVGNGQDQKRIE